MKWKFRNGLFVQEQGPTQRQGNRSVNLVDTKTFTGTAWLINKHDQLIGRAKYVKGHMVAMT
jgi:hypothetical protein